MTPAFFAALIDTLLPGELADTHNSRALPSGSVLGLPITPHIDRFRPLFQAILDHSGGTDGFIEASIADRHAIIDTIALEAGGQLRDFAIVLLQDYCDAPAVLQALGAPAEPPQPHGRDLAAADHGTLALLGEVRARGRIWR